MFRNPWLWSGSTLIPNANCLARKTEIRLPLPAPAFAAAPFDLDKDVVTVDLDALLQQVDFSAPIYDPVTFEVIGEGVGVECHSSPMQPDCPQIFPAVGLDLATGKAAAKGNAVFRATP